MYLHRDNNGASYYYPAVSYCYAYKPDGDNVKAEYGIHQWYLPNIGERQQLIAAQKNGTFAEAISEGVMVTVNTDYGWSCQERNGDTAYYVGSGGAYYYSKSSRDIVRAVAAF
jgi:hypothetical protein